MKQKTTQGDFLDVHFSLVGFVMLMAALITGVLAGFVYRKKAIPGRVWFFLSLLAVVLWSGFAGVEEMLGPLEWKIFMSKIEYFGVCSVCVFWFIFVVHYVQKEDMLFKHRRIWLLWIIPVVVVIASSTNEYHGLVWGTVVRGPGGNAIYGIGPLKLLSVAYAYLLFLAALVMLVQFALQSRGILKKQLWILAVASLIPWMSNVWYLTGWTPKGTDITPLAFALMSALVAVSLLRFNFLDIVPLACDSLFDNMDDGALILDSRDRLIEFNRRSGELFGLGQEMIGCDFFSRMESSYPSLSGLKELEKGSYEVNIEMTPSRWFDANITLLKDAHAQKLGKLIIFRETSDRKALIHELVELNRFLEDKVRRGVQENREKDHIMLAQSRQASMGEMLGNIAHQWRQPLNNLAVLIQNLPGSYSVGKLDEEYLQHFEEKGMGLIQYMAQTIDDFRNFFKPDKEKMYFPIEESVRKAVALVEQSLKDSEISLKLDLETGLTVEGFPNEFGQVLLILLQNAKDVLQERKVLNPTISVLSRNRDGKAEVTVEDNAGGIPPELMGRVFEPYFTTKKNGTGIGLYMSKLIIEKNMGGSITMRNDQAGAVFTILL